MLHPESPPTPSRSARPALIADLMAATEINEERLTALVHRYYDKVSADPMLGPVFAARITDWGPHLTRMGAFWSSVALMTGCYRGSPVVKHVTLPVTWMHFERWLELFRETVAETSPPWGVAHVIERVERIAWSLNFAIEDAARNRQGAVSKH